MSLSLKLGINMCFKAENEIALQQRVVTIKKNNEIGQIPLRFKKLKQFILFLWK